MTLQTFSGFPSVQVESEIMGLAQFIKENDIRSILEIGVGRGDNMHFMTKLMPEGSAYIGVDKPGSCWGFDESQKMVERAVEDLADYDAAVLYGDSGSEELSLIVRGMGPFDLVFIDGDHTLAGVMKDYDLYGDLGKYVAFHDIVDPMIPNLKGEVIEVPLFWEELKKKYEYVEFIEKGSTMGIGLIFREKLK